jgi:hypothetical protein
MMREKKKGRKEKGRIWPAVTVILLLAAAAAAVTVLYVFQRAENSRLEEQLKETEIKLEEQKLLTEQAEREEEEAREQADAAAAAVQDQEEAPVYLGDLETVPAGTVVSEEEVDRQNLEQYFQSYAISDELFQRIYGDDRSYKTYCTVPREDLRYIKVLHYGFDDQIYVGELMVNRLLEEDMTSIFRELFEQHYEIEKMRLIDDYGADDDLSCFDNNTSAFNYRLVTGGSTLSNHATGCAIDINPVNNPYVTFDGNGQPVCVDEKAVPYLDRSNPEAEKMHMITHDDLCYRLFTERGYTWGGDWSSPIDYQHFEKIVY